MIDPRDYAAVVEQVGRAMRAVGATHLSLDGLEIRLGPAPAPAIPRPEETTQIGKDTRPGPDPAPLSLDDLLFASSAG